MPGERFPQATHLHQGFGTGSGLGEEEAGEERVVRGGAKGWGGGRRGVVRGRRGRRGGPPLCRVCVSTEVTAAEQQQGK